MPFTIDLCQIKDVFIQLRVVKNTINIYLLGGTNVNQKEILANWRHLEEHFVPSLPEYKEWIRGSDAPHVKLQHSNEGEVEIPHWHNEFSETVTPEILQAYLSGILEQQRQAEHSAPEYQLITEEQCSYTLDVFGQYYKEYHGTTLEADYLAETALTGEEEREMTEAQQSKIGQAQVERLLASALLHTLFAPPTATGGSLGHRTALTLEDEPDASSDCTIM
jgi:hypothetical protein